MNNPFGDDSDDGEELPDILGNNNDNDDDYSDEEDELFVLEQLAWEPTRTQGKLVAIDVGKDTIIVATDKRVVILLKVDSDPQLFVVGKKEDLIHNLFVDPDANHLLVSMKNGYNFYINLTSSNASQRRKQTQTPLSKLKGITIESIVWNKNVSKTRTEECLIGTSNGAIYTITVNDGKEKHCNKLYDLKTGSYGNSAEQSKIHHSDNTCFRVCGLHIEYLNSPKEEEDDDEKKKDKYNESEQMKALKSLGFVDDDRRKHRKKNRVSQANAYDPSNAAKRFYIIAVIPSKIYEFIGGPTLNDVFKSYDDKRDMFKEIPGTLRHTKLCVYKPHNQMSEVIGWLTEPGIVLCKPVFGSHVTPTSGVIGDFIHENIIPYGGDKSMIMDPELSSDPLADDWHGMSERVPISFSVTQFHIVLVYEDCYLVINRLSKNCVSYQEIPCKKKERVYDIAIADNFIYVLTDSQIFQIRASDESRDVWQLFLSKNDFANAYRFSRNNWQKSKILRSEAEYYFENEHFREAALKYVELSDIAQQNEHTRSNIMSSTQATGRNVDAMKEADLWLDVSFEEIALKFLNKGANDALMTFLREKLTRIREEDKTQRTILATWLTEMHLSKINHYSALGDEDDEQNAIDNFEDFLKGYRDTLKNCPQVVFDLIASHGRTEQLVEFARIQQDWKWVLNHYIQNHDFKSAIRILATLQKPHEHEDLYYEFAPMLMFAHPSETVDMLMKVQSLDPKKLIPALMRYDTQQFNITNKKMDDDSGTGGMQFDMDDNKMNDDTAAEDFNEEKSKINSLSQEHTHQAIRYLQYCVEKGHEKSKDAAIHNYLISLYCKQETENELIAFIKSSKPLFDIKYALRLCHQENKPKSCVELYKIMGLFEEAIRLALTMPYNHYQLAKSIAQEFCSKNSNKNEQKRLWLLIAKHVVDKLQSDEIHEVLDIVNESKTLSIEDVLPHLKDFTEIGPFKKDIKQSLEKYSQKINDLQKDMDDYTRNAEQIRKDTKQLLLRSSMITSNRKCDLSGQPILNTQFVLFPCTHVFRFDALVDRVTEYRKQIEEKKPFADNDELVEYASSQCALCGDMMIDQVTRPFIDYEDPLVRKEAEEWHVGEGLDIFKIDSMKSQKSKPKTKTINLDDIDLAELNIQMDI